MIRVILIAFCALLSLPAPAVTPCKSSIAVPVTGENRIEANAAQVVRVLEPSFFGFNLEWVEFQRGLWDSANSRPAPGLLALLKDFSGAVYRYPGGTNSNHLNWKDTTGPITSRPSRKQVPWLDPLRAEFGVDEYLQFVKEVNGQAWYVVNLYGTLGAPLPSAQLAENAGDLAAHINKRTQQGFSQILRWELGNELDRANHKWPPEKLASSALLASAAIRNVMPTAQFVHLQQEYPALADQGFTANRYNKELRGSLARLNPDFAMHFYYDGPPETPPVAYFLKQLCEVSENARADGSTGNIWVTEHNRVPNGFWARNAAKDQWPATANLEAAISLSDMLIALAPIPEVRGAFTHSLVADLSPWPLVHLRANRAIEPTITLLAMKLLRQSMLPNVIASSQTSAGGGTFGADYAVRSTVMADQAGDNFALWTINRSNIAQMLKFELKSNKRTVHYFQGESISDPQVSANNYLSGTRVVIDEGKVSVTDKGNSQWDIELPPHSVATLRFSTRK